MQLTKILNRIGAVASSDTLNRVILSVLQERKKQGIQSLLVSEAFTVASTDNIDFLQSHATVYSGNQHWHATSIQLIHPKPSDIVRIRRKLFDTTNITTLSTASSQLSRNESPPPPPQYTS